MNGTKQHTAKEYAGCCAVLMGFLQYLGCRCRPFNDTNLMVWKADTRNTISPFDFLFFIFFLSCIIPGKTIAHALRHRYRIAEGFVGKDFLSMYLLDIMDGQHPQKCQCPCPICQGMVYFQIDAAAIICHRKEQSVTVGMVQLTARRQMFLPHHWLFSAFFVKIPEQPPPQGIAVKGEKFQCFFQGCLQRCFLHHFRQFTGETENLCIFSACGGRKYLCSVFQPAPLCITHKGSPPFRNCCIQR